MKKIERVLIIGTVWPEPVSSAAGSRMMQLISFFSKLNCDITFVTAAAKSEYSADLGQLGVTCLPVKLNSSDFDEMLKSLNPDAVMFDRFMTEEQFGWRVADVCPDAVRILDTEDLHCLRISRQIAFRQKKSFNKQSLLLEEIAKREIASIYRCDISLIISQFEYSLLIDQFSVESSLLHYSPFMIDGIESGDIDKLPRFNERSGFIHIGNFLHEPNWNAVLWLKEKIWPLIRSRLPDAKLSVYGSYPSQKVYQLHNDNDGFLIMGRAESSFEVMKQSKILLAPLRFGAGLKGKLIEAMQCGTPSVTTNIGAEGITGELEWPGEVHNNAADIANSAEALYQNKSSWYEAQKLGFDIINERFNRQLHEQSLATVLENLSKNLEPHRAKNFMGRMLMHHFSASTKFMSKWIEEKNRKSSNK